MTSQHPDDDDDDDIRNEPNPCDSAADADGDSDSSSSVDDAAAASSIQLGYCLPIRRGSTQFHRVAHRSLDWERDWDGGQIGGVPSWLDPHHIPLNPLRCIQPSCPSSVSSSMSPTSSTSIPPTPPNDPLLSTKTTTKNNNKNASIASPVSSGSCLQFVGQLYAPHPDAAAAFHRTLYLFGCPVCHNIRVLRGQLPRVNPYYENNSNSHKNDKNTESKSANATISTTASTTTAGNCVGIHENGVDQDHFVNDGDGDDTDNLIATPHDQQQQQQSLFHPRGLCAVCGFRATGRCPLQQQPFCGRDHQRLYKKHAKASTKTTSQQQEEHQVSTIHTTTTTTKEDLYHVSTLPGVYNTCELVVEEEPLPLRCEDHDDDKQHHLLRQQGTLFPSGIDVDGANSNNNADDDDLDDSDEDIEQDDLNEILAGGSKTSKDDATDDPPSRDREKKRLQRKKNESVYQHFTDRITERPNVKDQVLRYNCSWPDTTAGEPPLWIRHDHQPCLLVVTDKEPNDDNDKNHDMQRSSIPPCRYCGAERCFEFQLMPQLLHYLTNSATSATTTTASLNDTSTASLMKRERNAQDDYTATLVAIQQAESFLQQAPPETIAPELVAAKNAAIEKCRQHLLSSSSASSSFPRLDWGVVAVYTCSRSCDNSNEKDKELGSYKEEFAWVQPPVETT